MDSLFESYEIYFDKLLWLPLSDAISEFYSSGLLLWNSEKFPKVGDVDGPVNFFAFYFYSSGGASLSSSAATNYYFGSFSNG